MSRARVAAVLIAGALGASLAAHAFEATEQVPPATIDATGYQMHPGLRFHRRHVNEMALGCGTCHGRFGEDVLLVRPTPGAPRPINREVCLPCHQAPAKSTLYPCSGKPGKALCVLEPSPADSPPAAPAK